MGSWTKFSLCAVSFVYYGNPVQVRTTAIELRHLESIRSGMGWIMIIRVESKYLMRYFPTNISGVLEIEAINEKKARYLYRVAARKNNQVSVFDFEQKPVRHDGKDGQCLSEAEFEPEHVHKQVLPGILLNIRTCMRKTVILGRANGIEDMFRALGIEAVGVLCQRLLTAFGCCRFCPSCVSLALFFQVIRFAKLLIGDIDKHHFS